MAQEERRRIRARWRARRRRAVLKAYEDGWDSANLSWLCWWHGVQMEEELANV